MLLPTFIYVFAVSILWCKIRKWFHTNSDTREEVLFGFKGIPGIGFLPFLRGPSCFQNLKSIKKRYGPICKIRMGSFDCVWLNDYHLIKEAWSNPVFCGRPPMSGIAMRTKGFRGGIIFNDGKDFAEQRRFVISTLKSSGLGKRLSEQFILEEIQDLLATIDIQAYHPVSTKHLFNIPAFNIIWKLITGGSGFRHDDPIMSKLVTTLQRNMELTDGVCVAVWMPWLSRFFPKLTGWSQYVEDANFIFEFWQKFAQSEYSRFSENGNYQKGLIEEYCMKILQCSDKSSSFYAEKGVMSMGTVLQDLFIAGSETTATTLQWICLYLAAFPECQAKIFEEITIALQDNAGQIISLDLRSSLHYTEAFIKETLRVSTLAPLGMVHCTTVDVTFRNYYIPKGTIVQMNSCAVHFDPDCWKNPETFEPERFLNSEGTLRHGEILGFQPFSWGKRMCPGASVAKQTLFLATVSIIKNFEIMHSSEASGSIDLRPKVGISAIPCEHKLVFKPRK